MAFLVLTAIRCGAADSNTGAHVSAAAGPAVFIGLVLEDGTEPARGTRVQPGFHSLDLSATTDRIIGCPSANTWAIAVWWGSPVTAGGAPIEEALATCGQGSIAAAYSLDAETGTFLRYLSGHPDITTLEDIDLYEGIIALGSPSAAPPPLPIPAIAPGSLANCPPVGKWAISVPLRPYLAGVEEAFGTCESVTIAAAYALDPQTQEWSRYIAGRPDLTTLNSLDSMEGVLTLGAEPAQ